MAYTLHNTTAAPVDIPDLGITVQAGSDRNLFDRSRDAVAASADLQALLTAGTLTVLDGGQPLATDQALTLAATGVIKASIGLGNVTNVRNNLTATTLPGPGDDAADGYAVGSLWICGQRVWSCTDPTAGAASWDELTQTSYHPGVVAGRFYSSELDSSTTTGVIAQDILYAVPINFPAGTAWNRIGVEVTNATNGSSIRLGIYTNDHGVPGALAVDAGAVSGATVGLKEIVINFTNRNDWFWLVCCLSSSITLRAVSSPTGGGAIMGRTTTTDAGIRRVQANSPYGPLPATFGAATYSTANPPYIWIRKV